MYRIPIQDGTVSHTMYHSRDWWYTNNVKGDDLVRELRAMYPTLPLVVATGHDPAMLRGQLRNLDRIAYLAKPYTLQTLRDCLKTLGVMYPGAD